VLCLEVTWALPMVSHRPITARAERDPRSVNMGSVVEKVTLGRGFLCVLRISFTNIISPILNTHIHSPTSDAL
jgi:hypothetical protein